MSEELSDIFLLEAASHVIETQQGYVYEGTLKDIMTDHSPTAIVENSFVLETDTGFDLQIVSFDGHILDKASNGCRAKLTMQKRKLFHVTGLMVTDGTGELQKIEIPRFFMGGPHSIIKHPSNIVPFKREPGVK